MFCLYTVFFLFFIQCEVKKRFDRLQMNSSNCILFFAIDSTENVPDGNIHDENKNQQSSLRAGTTCVRYDFFFQK